MSFAKDFLLGIGPIPGLPGPGTFLQRKKLKKLEEQKRRAQTQATLSPTQDREALLKTLPEVERTRLLGTSLVGSS